MDDILGFPVGTTPGGEFTGIVKYDARSGRIFRIERTNTGNGYISEPVDITSTFKAVADLDNMQSGWMHFPPGSAPSLSLVPLEALHNKTAEKPAQPSANHKHGVRFRLKLSKGCAGDGAQLREIAGTSNAFLNSIGALYREYLAERPKYPDKLPVLVLSSAMPVVSGNGSTRSTNYQPLWRIDGWTARPEDMQNVISQPVMAQVTPLPQTAPATGNATVPPPNRYAQPPTQPAAVGLQANALTDDDFG